MKIPEVYKSETITETHFSEEDIILNAVKEIYNPRIPLSGQEIIQLVTRVFKRINNDYGHFNTEVMFLACSLAQHSHFRNEIELKDLLLLSSFFILGAIKFKGEDFASIENFFREDVKKFFNYNYAFLKSMTNLGDKARAYLFTEGRYDASLALRVPEMKFAALIFDAARIVVMLRRTGFRYNRNMIENLRWKLFCPELADVFVSLDQEDNITEKYKLKTYFYSIDEMFSQIDFTEEEKVDYLKCLVYIFDFKSTQTLRHVVNTASYALVMGIRSGCDKNELDELFAAGLLHDIGKMGIPGSVLESPASLSASDFTLMKIHVDYTKKILEKVVPKNIFDIAIRHHEKLDGSGYPYGLTASELTLQERIMTVADIFSALSDSRSYKEEFTKEKIVGILKELVDSNKIDSNIVSVIVNDYEGFKAEGHELSKLLAAPIGKIQELFNELQDFETLNEI